MTAIFGIPATDRHFDHQFAKGTIRLDSTEMEPIVRIYELDARNIENPSNDFPIAPWRYRGFAIAVAPFCIIDEVALQNGALSGFGGKRIIFWFPGKVIWYPIQRYWVS